MLQLRLMMLARLVFLIREAPADAHDADQPSGFFIRGCSSGCS